MRSIFTCGPPLFPATGIPKPQNSVCEKHFLCGTGVDFLPVTHIHVEHSVFRIRPYHRKVAAGNDILPMGSWRDRA
jgi:hypothetical protein